MKDDSIKTITSIKTISKIRTPNESPHRADLNEVSKNDKCKIHLKAIYNLNKKNEELSILLNEKIKIEQIYQKDIIEKEMLISLKLNEARFQQNEFQALIEDLNKKIKVLEKNSDYNELTEYYEGCIENLHKKNMTNLENFTKIINNLSSKMAMGSRDEVWRKLLTKYEKKIEQLEAQVHDLNKNERKIHSRQKFFEKYCSKAEEKIEKISKISKKYSEQENKLNELKLLLDKNQFEVNQNRSEKEILHKELDRMKNDNKSMQQFVNKIKPILKIEWEEIKNTNEENYEHLISSRESTDISNHKDKNIIILIENLNSFIFTISETIHHIDFYPIIQIIEDIKNYTIHLLKKIQSLTINQYHIINTCCDLNDRINNYTKREKNQKFSMDLLSIMKDIRNCCSKLLFDYKP